MNRPVGNDPGAGVLYIVATPIGNLSDIGERAVSVLRSVDYVLAEDTRITSRLLRHFSINAAMRSYHDHNASARDQGALKDLAAGMNIALLSDAGTPLLSDPGYSLVDRVLEMGLPLAVIPGPSALTAALARSGLPLDKFVFEGFLPAKAQARRKCLAALAEEQRTMVFFEAPHRLRATLADMVQCWGASRKAALVQEISKIHERTCRASLEGVGQWLDEDPRRLKGESVLLVAGAAPQTAPTKDGEEVLAAAMEVLPLSQAVDLAARITGRKPNELYRIALAKRGD